VSGACLALAAHLSLFPALLLVPCVALFPSMSRRLLFCLAFAAASSGLLYAGTEALYIYLSLHTPLLLFFSSSFALSLPLLRLLSSFSLTALFFATFCFVYLTPRIPILLPSSSSPTGSCCLFL
jgi:hypothetical protein